MRRPTAIALLLMIATMLSLPALATVGHETHACCRANGAHHCSASLQSVAGEKLVTMVGQRCPYAHVAVLPHAAQAQKQTHVPATHEAHPFLQEFVSGVYLTDGDDSHSERGPPLALR